MSGINIGSESDLISQFRTQGKQAGNENKASEMGKNEFLELMIAQLNNQNPLEPQENGEFLSQLAQFSSLEEMQKLSGNVDNVVGEFRSTQALQASSMVGRSVVVPSSTAALGPDGGFQGFVDVASTTSNLRLSVLDSGGGLVRQIDMGQQTPGQAAFNWDGKDASGNIMPPGKYSLKAEAVTGEGSTAFDTLVGANVDSVSLGKGSVTLNLSGMGSVALNDVRQIN